ncbi:hypothetical protein ACFQE1_05185 [Halobium palmae]|uniref:Uncharacterized protein n=1 Tax=Halobium palmae TaxID=1776492 RepID=A0ABD5RWZ1_9EURY
MTFDWNEKVVARGTDNGPEPEVNVSEETLEYAYETYLKTRFKTFDKFLMVLLVEYRTQYIEN